jgi:hypothetical protein
MGTAVLERVSATARRQLLLSMAGKRVTLTIRATPRGAPQDHDVVIDGIALDGAQGEGSKPRLLLATFYADGQRVVYDLREVCAYTERPFATTDPRHPEYEAPTVVVRPLPRKAIR